MLELIERIEALEGPDREVDAEIAALMGTVKAVQYTRGGPDEFKFPAYTASLDAAMTLVPEGAHWGIGHDASGPLAGWAWVRAKSGDGWGEHCSPPKLGFRHVAPFPATPALALCAAALRARLQEDKA